ncbi:MAG TPA: hypothetical protein PLU16_02580 [Gallionellaceae bacterium]|jgi:hypothetical protein|nr:hypothetical protein [Gallionellaceae bacterium]HQS74068.1 hypothetical protein [Gallionellaceae bacterium]
MKRNITSILFATFTFTLLQGCITPAPEIPLELRYQEPVQTSGLPTIVGSEEPNGIVGDSSAFVYSIDGKIVVLKHKPRNRLWGSVTDEPGGILMPLHLTEGHHELEIKFERSGQYYAYASTKLSVDLKKNMKYQVMFATDGPKFFGSKLYYCELWIVETGSGIALTKKIRIDSKDMFQY